jgi:hypothetical protein
MRRAGAPRINREELVAIAITGRIADPVAQSNPYRMGQDGQSRILPGPGGIVLNFRVGDRCVGLAADHVEPGVAIRNYRALPDNKDGANLALQTFACVGNSATVIDGPGAGAKGVVTGKHGGVNHVLIDFQPEALKRLRVGDRIQVHGYGSGLRFPDHPEISAMNLSVRLARAWGLRSDGSRLRVPVTHVIPAAVMGSGVGRNNAVRGDQDIQLFDPGIIRRFRLDRLRFGDLVAIAGADHRHGRAFHTGFVTIGVVVHSDSTVSGHGPGMTTLLSGDARRLIPHFDANANIAGLLGLRELPAARPHRPLIQKEGHERASRCECGRVLPAIRVAGLGARTAPVAAV